MFSYVFIPVLSDVLDQTAEVAKGFRTFILNSQATHPNTKAVFALVKLLRLWADVGRHFRSEHFLEWVLIQVPVVFDKRHLLQFFIGGHGKTGRLDGVTFGNPGIGGALAALQKLERLRTTKQLVDFCIARFAKRVGKREQKESDLGMWMVLHWQPESFPTSCKHLIQKSMQKLFCYEAYTKQYTGGYAPVKMFCHGIVSGQAKIEMRERQKPTEVGEYFIKARKPGYPWRRSH